MVERDRQTCWRWALTPAELLGGFHFAKAEATKGLPLEVRAFSCERRPLEGTGYTFQIALSNCSVSPDVQELRRVQPNLPASGDRRSGIILFDAEEIIGALIIRGNLANQGYKLFVHHDYRQRGLAFQILVEWCWLTMRPKVLPNQGITLLSTKALLAAHKVVVARAQQNGKPVPQRVLNAIASGEEERALLREAERIEHVTPEQIQAERIRRYRGGRHG